MLRAGALTAAARIRTLAAPLFLPRLATVLSCPPRRTLSVSAATHGVSTATAAADSGAVAAARARLPLLFNSWDDPFVVVYKPAGLAMQLRGDLPAGQPSAAVNADANACDANANACDADAHACDADVDADDADAEVGVEAAGRGVQPSVMSLARLLAGSARPVYLVHRLDKHTAGALVLALHRAAASELQGSVQRSATLNTAQDELNIAQDELCAAEEAAAEQAVSAQEDAISDAKTDAAAAEMGPSAVLRAQKSAARRALRSVLDRGAPWVKRYAARFEQYKAIYIIPVSPI